MVVIPPLIPPGRSDKHAMRRPRSGAELVLGVGDPPADHRGQIMKMLTSAELFAPPKRTRKTRDRDWLERAKLVVAEARESAAETARQRAAHTTRPPSVLQRRRLTERLSAKNG